MRLVPRTLLGRTALVFAVLLIATQAITFYLFRLYYYGPLLEETARRAVSQIDMVRTAIGLFPIADREEFFEALEAREQIRVLYDNDNALAVREAEDDFLRAFSLRLRAALGPETTFFVQPKNARALWVRLAVAEERFWIGIPRAQIEAPFPWWWVVWASVCVVLAAAAAYATLRRVNRPLQALKHASGEVAAGRYPDALAPQGPEEIRSVAEGFNLMLGDLKQRDEDRAMLLAGISHDLRTPLARIRLGVEMLDGDAQLKGGLIGDTEDMDAMIGQFLDFARTQDEEAPQIVPLNALLDSISTGDREYPQGLRLKLDREVCVRAQPLGLRRAIVNLLDNARKYANSEIEIGTEVETGCVAIRVLDRGPGIPPDQVAWLLRPFTRLERARSGAGGAGLGLAIVQRFAQRNAGTFKLLPRDGGGTQACLELPVADAG